MNRKLASFLLIAVSLIATAGRYYPRHVTGSGGGQVVTYPWRFGILTDVHCRWLFGGSSTPPSVTNDTQLGEVIDTLEAMNVDLLVIGGDWNEDGFIANPGRYGADSLMSKLGRFTGIVLPVMGNHEAVEQDTLLGINPYTTARARFPARFEGKNWYKYDHKNIRFIAVQNNANYDIDTGDDYRVNNPTSYAAPTGGITGYDFDGITVPSSPQRVDLASYTRRTDVGGRWVITMAHRGIYGCNSNNEIRQNFGRAARGTGYIKAIEDSLPTGRRGINLFGDQHNSYIMTKAIRDSALATAPGKGLYHLIVASGSGSRQGDSTSVPAGFYDSYVFNNSAATANIAGGTTGTVVDTFTIVGNPCHNHQWTWSLCTVYADVIMVETFFVYTTCQAQQNSYRAGGHELIDRVYLYRDVD